MKKGPKIPNITILIVDDSHLAFCMIESALRSGLSGMFNIIFKNSCNFLDAISKIESLNFDIALLDGHLDIKDGVEFFGHDLITHIKLKNSNTVIVMCSDDDEQNEKGLKKGVHLSFNKSSLKDKKKVKRFMSEIIKQTLESSRVK